MKTIITRRRLVALALAAAVAPAMAQKTPINSSCRTRPAAPPTRSRGWWPTKPQSSWERRSSSTTRLAPPA